MDSSGYSGDPACGRSPVQFRVCPKRVMHQVERLVYRVVETLVNTKGALFRRGVSLRAMNFFF